MTKNLLCATLLALLISHPALAETTLFTNTLQKGSVKGAISFTRPDGNQKVWQDLSVQITRQGQVYNAPAPSDFVRADQFSTQIEPSVEIMDWEGDQDPEVMVTFYNGRGNGYHFSILYSFDRQRKQYRAFNQSWGTSAFSQFSFRDMDGDGRFEYTTNYDPFPPAFSYGLLQILQLQDGKLVEITHKFPTSIREGADYAWKDFQNAKKETTYRQGKGKSVQPHLAAFITYKYMLGEGEAGVRQAKAAYKLADSGEFFRTLTKILREQGYAP